MNLLLVLLKRNFTIIKVKKKNSIINFYYLIFINITI